MKILVCVSKTPDTTSKISFTDGNTKFDENGVQFILNPYDEWYALVRALELVEQHTGTVTVINVGDDSNDSIVRKALAIGADDAVRIDLLPSNSMQVAANIAAFAENKGFDLILTGKETIDYNGSEVGAMIAEYLGWPFVSYASKLEHNGTIASIRRDIEGGVEVVEVSGSFVLSAAKGLAEQRIPNMKGIMMAKKKPFEILATLKKVAGPKVVSYTLPKEKGGVKMIDPENMDELVRLLHEEAKVI